MKPIRPSADVRSLSEFRANVASLVQQVQKTRRPLVLTVHGRGAAVVLDVATYEDLVDRLELLDDLRVAEAEIDAGLGVPHPVAKSRVLKRYRK
jgi:prevent-host-death family protein